MKTTDRNGNVVALIDVRDEDELIMITAKGMVIRTPVRTIRSIGRNTQGVTLFSVEEGDKLVSVARVLPEEPSLEEGLEVASDGNAPENINDSGTSEKTEE